MNERVSDELLTGLAEFFPGPSVKLAGKASSGGFFVPQDGTLGTAMRFVAELPEQASDAQRQLIRQQYQRQRAFLEGAVEMACAWLERRFSGAPKEWTKAENWWEPLRNMPAPFYQQTNFQEVRFDQVLRGVELSEVLQETLVEGSARGPGCGMFANFCAAIGEQIYAQADAGRRSVATYHVALSYRPVRDAAGDWQLSSSADIYLLGFQPGEQKLYISCRTGEILPFAFDYLKATLRLDGAALNDPGNALYCQRWEEIMASRVRVSLEQNRNFFEQTFNLRG